ncbi:hypothetical protein HID58_043824, partial [Brassica napus]
HTSGQIPHAAKGLQIVISELRADNQANRTHIRSITGMFDVLAEKNPALAAIRAGRVGGMGRSPQCRNLRRHQT